MREPRGQLAKIADTITGSMRRRQRDREPRVLLYDSEGRPRLVAPDTEEQAAIVEVAERLVAMAGAREPEAPE